MGLHVSIHVQRERRDGGSREVLSEEPDGDVVRMHAGEADMEYFDAAQAEDSSERRSSEADKDVRFGGVAPSNSGVECWQTRHLRSLGLRDDGSER
eukprot:3095328-Alexandrium_andersonii.AAC.1